MRAAEYPFNKALLIGMKLSWIPDERSDYSNAYLRGERWYYELTVYTDRQLKLKELKTGKILEFKLPINRRLLNYLEVL
jgi:hypothetical protein